MQVIRNLQRYRYSLLIPVEFFLFLTSIFGALITFGGFLVFIFRKRWTSAIFSLTSFFFTVALITLGLSVDEATLLYIT